MGEEEVDPLPEPILASLGKPFALSETWNDTALLSDPERYYGYELMAGAMPITTEGSALDYWLVVTGPGEGQIWFDKRTDSLGVEPVTDGDGNILTFGQWYQDWLDRAWARFTAAP